MSNPFKSIIGNHPRLSYQKRSYDKKFDCDMGQLIPICLHYGQPGEVVKLSNEIVVRANPLVAPILHEVDVYTYYFACPLRLLFGETIIDSSNSKVKEWRVHDHDFEIFLSGGVDGQDNSVTIPRWQPTGKPIYNDNFSYKTDASGLRYMNLEFNYFEENKSYYHYVNGFLTLGRAGTDYVIGQPIKNSTIQWFMYDTEVERPNEYTPDNGYYSLWDYMEFPTNVIPKNAYPTDFTKRMYNFVFNEYFRDETLDDILDVAKSNKVMNCRWKKDYFTSALPFQQRGIASAFPVQLEGFAPLLARMPGSERIQSRSDRTDLWDTDTVHKSLAGGTQDQYLMYQSNRETGAFQYNGAQLGIDPADLSLTTFDVSDLRLAVQVQRWLELNARAGARWKEFLLAHFGVCPKDERLQRPEYIAGSKSPMIISEVLQTSQTTQGIDASPQGNLAGHGLSADSSFIAKYHCKEHMLIMGIMCIRPKASYQQGIKREELYNTKYDFFFPEFAHLSEQPVYTAELFATENDNVDSTGQLRIFGYQGRYNELRSSRSCVCGGLREKFDYWHLGRKFNAPPALNTQFLKCVPDKRIFAVPSEPGFIVDVGNIIDSYSPVPIDSMPGLVDHV